MQSPKLAKTIRRSVALPREIVEEALALAPSELRNNLNRLVITALQEYVARQKALGFEEAMAQMAADPVIQSASRVISREFEPAEADGLEISDDSTRPGLLRKPQPNKRTRAGRTSSGASRLRRSY